ncbi:UvrD-helicase domain-containing protein, partial [Rheinheimera sp.]|uniref:UvrD-helicase domain-containing protein n=1 Tax=Rheinheimera sp. TaxID=1869214 RepID=UPI0027B9DFCD
MPNSSESAQPSFIEMVVPNKIFEITRFESAHIEHNCSITALIDPVTIGYIYDLDRIVSVLTDPDIIKYQDKLLQEAVKGISDKTVDIDHIQIGLKLTEQDYDVLMDKKTGLTNVKTKNRMARLHVTRKGLGAVNRGFKKSDRRPFFSHKYRMFMDADLYRYIDVLIADPRHPRNQRKLAYNCLIECIPTRLTPQHISLMLFHIKSALKPGRYDQLVEYGLLLRIDTGYIMHGVSQLFAFTMRNDTNVKKGSCIPDDGRAVETTYIGHRDYKHVIAYDKVLKENKLFIEKVFGWQRIDFERIADQIEGLEQWFPNQAASLRIESRELLAKEPLLLREMNDSSSLLQDVVFVRPEALLDIESEKLKDLLKNKSLYKVRSLRKRLAAAHKYMSNKYLIKFDAEQVHAAFTPIVNQLKQKILHPSNRLPEPFPINYSAQVIAARQLVKPLIEKLRSKHDSPNKIVRSAKSAIYVEGCPGSGKTKLIIKRVKHLLNSGVDAANICVLAFTREASNEFKTRLSEKGLLRPEMFVGTFSSWCNQELLNRPHGKVLNQEKCVEAIKQLLPKKGKLVRKFDNEDLARTIFSILSYAANFDQPKYDTCIDKIAPQLEDLKKEVIGVISEFAEWKKEGEIVDFNDLLVKSRNRLTEKKKADKTANRFEHIILDEVQDTNSV